MRQDHPSVHQPRESEGDREEDDKLSSDAQGFRSESVVSQAASGKNRGQTDLSTIRIRILRVRGLRSGTDSSVPGSYDYSGAARRRALEPEAGAHEWTTEVQPREIRGVFHV